ncbi:DNA alkylation repair protein [Kitasatospora sp. GP82]|uniref:DNA alkylation repair protein n=1 Tax=Kitasatospora sp. GP82 TaxID=3035089 RepID=UPI0024758595|nr:DNA alkylation repair protein [Kitasatospora sp. GP82]MDH6127241.1 3-methyladenine DNA glycosylase AlkD [Kitasatospora sp. GP82]
MATPAAPTGAVAESLLHRLEPAFRAAADPVQAARMSAYMRHQFSFLGLPAPARRTLARTVLEGTPHPAEADCTALALACWELPEREYQYFATDYLARYADRCSSAFLPTVRHLISTRSWWDTVDPLASHVVGRLVAADPGLRAEMDAWIRSDNLWIARTALLHQLRHRGRTAADRLFTYCTLRSGDSDFFIRKAIGWALREYGKTEPTAVRRYVEQSSLSPLSVREALKNL